MCRGMRIGRRVVVQAVGRGFGSNRQSRRGRRGSAAALRLLLLFRLRRLGGLGRGCVSGLG